MPNIDHIMINLQHVEKSNLQTDGSLDVIDVWLTIQGEGPFVGMPAVFVRLAGCNLQCPLCDTDYTTDRFPISAVDLAHKVEKMQVSANLVVFTGGEPLRQNLLPVVKLLMKLGFAVQIETNGTLFPAMPYRMMTVVCSPKTATINAGLRPHITAYKYVIQHGHVDPKDGLPTSVLGADIRPARPAFEVPPESIYVQPCDERDEQRNKLNMITAVQSCLEFGYRLCLQVHKIAGLK